MWNESRLARAVADRPSLVWRCLCSTLTLTRVCQRVPPPNGKYIKLLSFACCWPSQRPTRQQFSSSSRPAQLAVQYQVELVVSSSAHNTFVDVKEAGHSLSPSATSLQIFHLSVQSRPQCRSSIVLGADEYICYVLRPAHLYNTVGL